MREEDLEEFDHNSAPAANSPEVDVHMDVFLVKKWQGNIAPDNEVEEIGLIQLFGWQQPLLFSK